MPLFAVSNEGRLHKLLTPHDGHSGCTVDSGEFEDPSNDYVIWQELPYLGVEIKQASAGGRSVWALGGDRQIYVLVHSVDLPIRIKEEAFENQRWLPLGNGFSRKLLPTDRPHFSSEDGLVERELERVVLPSPAWQWEESSWRVEASLNGQPLDAEGWTYAVDFPATYYPEKSWKSCVRRRKWVRHRVYAAVDGWSAIPPLNDKDPTEEPFIDICVGGQSIVGAPKGHLSVWAVTAKGRVLFREGVTWTCPEGVGWSEVAVGGSEEAQEVKQVGVGPQGNAWCILWNGHALVRAGVARDHLKGDLWVSLPPPSPGAPLPGCSANATSAPLSQISVGAWGAWAVTVDGRTWYRRGIRSSNGGEGSATERLLGQGWVEMVGCMSVISVGPNDQVWAIGMEDRLLYMRTGVLLPSEPTGRAWRHMQLPVAVPTQLPDGHHLESSSTNRQLPSMSRESSVSREEDCTGTEGESLFRRGVPEEARPTGNVVHGSSLRNRAALAASGAVASSLAFLGNAAASHSSAAVADAGERAGGDESETESCAFGHPHEELDDEWEGGWGSEEEGGGLEEPSSLEGGKKSRLKAEPLWAWVTGGSCIIDPHQNPPWFVEPALGCEMASLSLEDDSGEGDGLRKHGSGKGSRPTQAWRAQLLHLMRERRDREEAPLERNHFEEAIETSSWVKSGKVLCLLPSSSTLTPHSCTLELEWVYGAGCLETEDDAVKQDAGTLTALSADGNRTLLQWSLSDIRCIAPCKGWGVSDASSDGSLSPAANDADSESSMALYSQPRLAIHSTQTAAPLRLQFASEKDLEDWTSILTSVCCQLQGLQGPPKPGSIWAATSNGDVFVFDPSNLKLEQWERRGHGNSLTGESEVGHFAMEWSFRGKQAPYTRELPNGMPTGSTVEIHGTINNQPKRFAVNLIVGSGKKNQRTIALHLNPRFEGDNCASVVCNSMVNGTWREEERMENCELASGNDFIITISSSNDCFQVHVQGQQVMADNVSVCSSSSVAPLTSTTTLCFNHRMSPNSISLIEINGDVTVTTVSYASPQVIVGMESVFWRQVGGHFRVVEACPLGVVWAIAYDGTPWIHTGGWGGAFLEGMGEATTSQHLLGSGGVGRGSSAGAKVQAMSDTRAVHVYENQRWNPLTGYSSVGLPTDRPSWSDRSGRHRRSKDSSRLPSRHWHWATEWSVDFSVSGGVDSEGWQYAVDYPATFHASRGFTDYVRRRRWVRVAKLSTQGPWRPLPHTPLASVSLHADEEPIEGDGEGVAWLWAIAANSGEVLYRHGVTKSTPAGSSWDCVVGGEQPFVDISCGGHNQVWAIGRNGAAYWRFGINSASPTGQVWVHVEPPAGRKLRQISVAECERGQLTVWALDSLGALYVRREMTPVFPEGTHWQCVGEAERGRAQAFGHVSVGPGGEVWATHSSAGCVLRRLGRHAADTAVDPAWARGVNASMQYVSTHGWRLKMS